MPTTPKVLLTGSSELSEKLEPLVEQLAERLMQDTSLTLVTGGLRCKGKRLRPALDGIALDAALRVLADKSLSAKDRIVTMLPEKDDVPGFERAKVGSIELVPYSGLRTRRYAMALKCDAVIGIGGRTSTKEILDLAFIQEKPLLVYARSGGAAEEAWQEYGVELERRLALTKKELAAISNKNASLSSLVSASLQVLGRVLRPTCFVAMAFVSHPVPGAFSAIRAAADRCGLEARRVDKEAFVGDIVEQIWMAIRHSDLLIVDVTGLRPNVFYELGIGHALGKPVLLAVHSPDGHVPRDLPFDIAKHRTIAYGDEHSLQAQLLDMLPPLLKGIR